MGKLLLLIAMAIPPWIAVKLGAPKWGVMLSIVPFGLIAMSRGDPDEDMFGDASSTVRRWLLLLMGVGGLVFGVSAWALKDTFALFGLFWWVLPFSLILLVAGVVGFLRK